MIFLNNDKKTAEKLLAVIKNKTDKLKDGVDEKLSDDEIMDVEIPNFPPLVFEFDDNLNVQNEYYLAPKKA